MPKLSKQSFIVQKWPSPYDKIENNFVKRKQYEIIILVTEDVISFKIIMYYLYVTIYVKLTNM